MDRSKPTPPKAPGIGVEPQVGQVVVDTTGFGIGPGQGIAVGVLLLAVPGGSLEVQLDGAAHAEGGGYGDGAHMVLMLKV